MYVNLQTSIPVPRNFPSTGSVPSRAGPVDIVTNHLPSRIAVSTHLSNFPHAPEPVGPGLPGVRAGACPLAGRGPMLVDLAKVPRAE